MFERLETSHTLTGRNCYSDIRKFCMNIFSFFGTQKGNIFSSLPKGRGDWQLIGPKISEKNFKPRSKNPFFCWHHLVARLNIDCE